MKIAVIVVAPAPAVVANPVFALIEATEGTLEIH
jgi:hypothetical protein